MAGSPDVERPFTAVPVRREVGDADRLDAMRDVPVRDGVVFCDVPDSFPSMDVRGLLTIGALLLACACARSGTRSRPVPEAAFLL
jgi:hypothetical protein